MAVKASVSSEGTLALGSYAATEHLIAAVRMVTSTEVLRSREFVSYF